MGRTQMKKIFLVSFLFAVCIFSFSISAASPFRVKVTYHGELEDFYTGGEYILLITDIKPVSTSEGRKLDGIQYDIFSRLQDCGVIVEVNLTSGKSIFHPTPDDYYERRNGTELKFYLPDGGSVGVERITVKIYGYVSEISERIENVTILSVTAGDEKIVQKNITVVNKPKFYSDIKELRNEICEETDATKLDEALSLYYDEKFEQADAKIREVEKSVAECKSKEEKKELEDMISEIDERLSNLKRDLTMIEVKMEINRDKLKDYTSLHMQFVNLTSTHKTAEKLLDEALEKVYDGKFDEARERILSAQEIVAELEKNVTSFSAELEQYISSSQFDWTWIATWIAIGISAAVVAFVVILYIRGMREKW